MQKDTLRQYIPFSDLQDDYLDEVINNIKEETLKKGAMLFKRGKVIKARYFLLEGKVDLIDSSYVSHSVRSGTEQAKSVLNADSPTLYSCIAKDPIVKVYSIDAEVLDRLVAWSQSAESAFEAERGQPGQPASYNPRNTGPIDVVPVDEDFSKDWMSTLLSSPLFSTVPLTLVQDLFSKFENVAVNSGDRVVQEGEAGDYFYVIARGSARVTNNIRSVDVVINTGGHFGEEALLGDTPRNATVTMIEDGELKRLGAEDFQSLLTEPVLKYIDSTEYQNLTSCKLIDVKMPLEYRLQHVEGSINIPLARLRSKIYELGQSNTYVITDDSGSRSKIAAHLLCQAGFDTYILSDSSKLTNAAAPIAS